MRAYAASPDAQWLCLSLQLTHPFTFSVSVCRAPFEVSTADRAKACTFALAPLIPVLRRYPEYESALLEQQLQERSGKALSTTLHSALQAAGSIGSPAEPLAGIAQQLVLELRQSVSTVFLTLAEALPRWCVRCLWSNYIYLMSLVQLACMLLDLLI